nr:MOP flippase family protein [Serratia bockelmannii]
MGLKAKAFNGAKWTAFSTACIVGIGLLQMAILARLIGPKEFGLLSAAMVIIALADTLSDFGISNSIIQKKDISQDELTSLYWFNVGVGFLVFLIFFVCGKQIAAFLNLPGLNKLIELISIAFLFIPHGQQYRALLQKELEFSIIGKVEAISFLLGFLFTVCIAFYYPFAISAIWGYLINAASRTVLFYVHGVKMYKPTLSFSLYKIKGNLKFGAYLTADNLVNFINVNISTVVLAKLLGPIAVGGYNLAYNMTVIPPMKLNPIITRVLFPAFSKIQDDIEKLRLNFYKLLSLVGIINFPLLLGLMLVSDNFVLFAFGEKWKFIIPTMQVLCVVGLLRSIGNPIGALLMAKARVDISFKFNVFKTVLFLPTLYIGGLYYGVEGVAIGFLIVQIVNTFLSYFILIKPVLGNSYREYLLSLLIPLKISLPMLMSVWLFKFFMGHYFSLNNTFTLFSSIFIGGFIFVITIFLSSSPLLVELKKIIKGKF